MGQLGKSCVTLLRVVSFKIEDVKLALKSCHDQFVHHNIWPIEFNATDSVLNVRVPTQAVSFEIEYFYVSVVITCGDTSLFLIVCIPKSNCPAVWLDRLTLTWLQTYNRRLLTGIPNSNTPISSTCNQFRGAKFCSFAPYAINSISDVCMCLYFILSNASLNIINRKFSFVVNSGDVSDTNGRHFEGPSLDSKLLLPFAK